LLSASLADGGLETSLDGGNGAPGSTTIAGDEEKAVFSLLKIRIRGLAGSTGNVFQDITPKNVFQLLLLEFAPNDQPLATID